VAVSVKVLGGDKWRGVLEKYVADGSPLVKVGILEGSTYSGESTAAGMPVAAIAAIHEFGAPGAGIPARSFMRSTVAEKQDEWAKAAGEYLKGGHGDARAALTLVGEMASRDMQEKIESGIGPALTVATITSKAMRKGRAANNALPLVDTGTLQESISYEVEG
jgi:phage gpG-like protein